MVQFKLSQVQVEELAHFCKQCWLELDSD